MMAVAKLPTMLHHNMEKTKAYKKISKDVFEEVVINKVTRKITISEIDEQILTLNQNKANIDEEIARLKAIKEKLLSL